MLYLRKLTVGVIGAVTLTIVAACASGTSSYESPGALPDRAPDVLYAPQEVAGLAVTDSMRYPQPELGTTYRYRGQGPLRPDIYIYPRGPNDTVEAQVRSFRQALEINRQRGQFTKFRVMRDSTWSPVRWAEGREVVAVLQSGQRTLDSYFYVFRVGDQFVKVRTSVSQGEVTIDQVRAFITEFFMTMSTQTQFPRTETASSQS